jgi:hypothetical protein
LTTFNFEKIISLAVIVVGMVLAGFLHSIDNQMDTNAHAADGGRSLLCLQMKAEGQPVNEYAPCMRPSVYKLWKDEPVSPVASHKMICEAMAAFNRQIEECK